MKRFTPIKLILQRPFQTKRGVRCGGRSRVDRPRNRPGFKQIVHPSEQIMAFVALHRQVIQSIWQRQKFWLLLLCGLLGPLASNAAGPGPLRLVGAVPSGFEQTHQLHFKHVRVDEYTASASPEWLMNTRIRLEQQPSPVALDLADALKHYESAKMVGCRAADLTTIFSGAEQGYQTIVMLTVCPKMSDLDLGYLRFTKAILADALYFVAIEQPVPAFDDAKAGTLQEPVVFWTDLLKQFIVCSSKSTTPACITAEAAR